MCEPDCSATVRDRVIHDNTVKVRKEKCKGCLYGKEPVARNYKEGIKHISETQSAEFICHEHLSMWGGQKVLCNGFYKAHKNRLAGKFIEWIATKGKFSNYWNNKEAGTAHFNK